MASSSAKRGYCTEGLWSSEGEKHGKQELVDRISSLPDAVLTHILSFLTTQYAVATGILSTRWRYLWTCVPVLHFEDWFVHLESGQSLERGDCERMFTHFVDRVLSSHKVESIQKFHLGCSGKYYAPSPISAWIDFAIMRNVVELDLSIGLSAEGALHLPESLFSCEKLEVLKIANTGIHKDSIILNVPDSVSLPRLRVLHLSFLNYLSNDIMMRLLSGVPILEELQLSSRGTTCMYNLYVDLSLLKRLKIDNNSFCDTFDDPSEVEGERYKVIVNAPNLEFLEFLNFTRDQEFEMMELPSIVEARIVLGNHYGVGGYYHLNEAVRLFRRISNVKVLSLSGQIFKILHKAQQLLDSHHFSITFHNLTHLEVFVKFFCSFDMLEAMPNLEVLVLSFWFGTRWQPPKNVPRCFLSCLEMVKFRGLSASKEQLKIIKYLLENAEVLKMMTLSFSFCHLNPNELNDILSFPRASSSCRILFVDWK